jgi:hypothetical protein
MERLVGGARTPECRVAHHQWGPPSRLRRWWTRLPPWRATFSMSRRPRSRPCSQCDHASYARCMDSHTSASCRHETILRHASASRFGRVTSPGQRSYWYQSGLCPEREFDSPRPPESGRTSRVPPKRTSRGAPAAWDGRQSSGVRKPWFHKLEPGSVLLRANVEMASRTRKGWPTNSERHRGGVTRADALAAHLRDADSLHATTCW